VHLMYMPAQLGPTSSDLEARRLPDEEDPSLKRPVPPELSRELEQALRLRDAAAFSKAMDALEALDPQEQGFNDRMQHFTEGLQDVLMNPTLMADGGSEFVLQVVESRMRQPTKPTPSRSSYASHRGPVRKNYRAGPVDDATVFTMSVPSHLDDWENTAAFGRHPGLLYGIHSACELATRGATDVFGADFVSDYCANWEKEHPNAALDPYR